MAERAIATANAHLARDVSDERRTGRNGHGRMAATSTPLDVCRGSMRATVSEAWTEANLTHGPKQKRMALPCALASALKHPSRAGTSRRRDGSLQSSYVMCFSSPDMHDCCLNLTTLSL